MIYFCPITCAWEPIRRGLFESTIDTIFSVDSYVWYADNGNLAVEGIDPAGFAI